jgi:hypothetical protein
MGFMKMFFCGGKGTENLGWIDWGVKMGAEAGGSVVV